MVLNKGSRLRVNSRQGNEHAKSIKLHRQWRQNLLTNKIESSKATNSLYENPLTFHIDIYHVQTQMAVYEGKSGLQTIIRVASLYSLDARDRVNFKNNVLVIGHGIGEHCYGDLLRKLGCKEANTIPSKEPFT